MAASLTLNSEVRTTGKGTTSLKLFVVGYDISPKVFAIEVLPGSADKLAPKVRFSHVCSPAELAEFPEDAPGDCCYFRVSEIEMVFDTPDFVEHVMSNMKKDIAKLVREYNDLAAAVPVVDSVQF